MGEPYCGSMVGQWPGARVIGKPVQQVALFITPINETCPMAIPSIHYPKRNVVTARCCY